MNDGHLHHYKECNANGSEEVPVRYVLAGEAHRHLYSTNGSLGSCSGLMNNYIIQATFMIVQCH